MKEIAVFAFVLFLTGCVQQEPLNKVVYSERTSQDILLGKVDRTGFQLEQFSGWFNEEYNNYTVDKDILDSIPDSFREDIEITIILATWCPDSRRELPRFLKILDFLRFDEENINYFGVNREKVVPDLDLSHLGIEKVPTMILFRNGNEVGRIIESPVKTLEKDLLEFAID
jgi:thiol-disulfide isomerase/thioredoxin